MSEDSNGEIDREQLFYSSAWLILPCIAFLLVPARVGTTLRLTAAIAAPIALFVWATRSPNRSRPKRMTLLALRRILHGATATTMTAGITVAVAIGLFARSDWPVAVAILVLAAVLRVLLWLYDLWVERDWRRFGQLDENGMPVIREMTMREYAASLVTSRQRNRQLAPAIGFWGELLANNDHSDIVASMMTARRVLDATAAPGDGANFVATREGSFVRVTALTAHAAVWLQQSVSVDSTWLDKTLVIEMRYFPDIAEAIIENGFLFERNVYLS
ncbi:MAG: hypothetical protein ACRYG4_24980 [Janthinobacterium lividum]